MSHLNPGLISAYNSLTDKHLAGYFSNTQIRRHLRRAGLITRSGRIVPEKEYRHELIQKQHQRKVREGLAQAVFRKVLEMERVHQTDVKRRLEEFARRERVHKVKLERSKRYEEGNVRIMSPCPPTGVRAVRKQHSGPAGEPSGSSEAPGSSRPNTAPGKMQRPVRLKPIHSKRTASLRRSSPYRLPDSSNEKKQTVSYTMESHRYLTWRETSCGISPYCLPVINNFVTPLPPPTKTEARGERGVKVLPIRGRRLRLTAYFKGANEDSHTLRSIVFQSKVSVNMMYFGKKVHLSHDLHDVPDEVKVFQQHCGGENLCVYKGLLCEGETFQFISRRHRGFPFSLTFSLNGLQVERLSSCCEFKHRKGSRLGGIRAHFGFTSVEGASPCYKCIISMGLDKKPTPPPKKVEKNGAREEPISSQHSPDVQPDMNGEDAAHHSARETNQKEEVVTATEEGNVRDDYEEDFVVDDEGSADDAEAIEKKSSSPFTETQSEIKDGDTSGTEDDENDDVKSLSSSSSSGSSQEVSDNESDKPEEADQEDTVIPPEVTNEPNPEEATVTESTATKDSDIQNSARESTETGISVSSITSGDKSQQYDGTSEDKEIEKMVNEDKQEEEQARAKSVQEKLAEAVQIKSTYSSGPELSDTSTEDEYTHKGPKEGNKVSEESVTLTEPQQNLKEQKKSEEGYKDKPMVQDGGGACRPNEDEMEKNPHENSDGQKDASDETTAENKQSIDTENTPLHAVSEDKMVDMSSDHEIDAHAAAKDVEKTTVAADSPSDEREQEANNNEEDESPASEPNKKSGETAVMDSTEVGAVTASETAEMQAEFPVETEAFNCEEASHTEERQQIDRDDRVAASHAEVIRESGEGSGDATVEIKAEISASGESKIIKQEPEEGSIKQDRKEKPQKRCDVGEEHTHRNTEKLVETDEVGEDPKEEGKEQEKKLTAGEMTEGASSENRRGKDNEIKISSNVEGKDHEQAEETHGKDNKTVGTLNESENTEKDEESVMNEDEEEKEATLAGENIAVKKMAADEDRNDQEEKEESNENKAEQNEDSPENVKISDGNIVELVDASNSDEADIEVKTDVREAADEKKEGEIDAESGEISSRGDSKAPTDTGEAPPQGQNGGKVAEHTEDEIKNEEPTESESSEVKESTTELEFGIEIHKSDTMDQAPDTDISGTGVEEDHSEEMQDKSTLNWEPQTSGVDMKGETKQVGNFKFDETEYENRDSLLLKNIQNNVTVKASSNEQSSMLIQLNGSAHKLGDSIQLPETNQQVITEAATNDISAAKGENGETEGSKASEEGASMHLRPQAYFSSIPEKEKSFAAQTSDVLAGEDNIDLVSNWVTMHHASKFFETFAEPLDELKESHAQVNHYTQSTEPLESVSPLRTLNTSENSEQEQMPGILTKEEVAESDLEIALSKDGVVSEKEPITDVLQAQEETEVTKSTTDAESQDKVSMKGEDTRSERSRELVQDNTEHRDVSKSGAESFVATYHSVISGSPESVSEKKTEWTTSDNSPDLSEKQTVHLQHSTEMKEQGNHTEIKGVNMKNLEETGGEREEVSEVTDLTGNGDQEDSPHNDTPPKTSDENINGDGRDVWVIHDIQHGKDRLSPISGNEILFGPNSDPLPAVVRIESGH